MHSVAELTEEQLELAIAFNNIVTRERHLPLPSLKEPGTHISRTLSPLSDVRVRYSRSASRLPPSLWHPIQQSKSGPPSAYPTRRIKRYQFLQMVSRAKATNDLRELKKFYFSTFESLVNVNATFKKDALSHDVSNEDPGLETELVYVVLDTLKEVPHSIHKQFLKALTNLTLEENAILLPGDRIRGLFIVIQSPVFLAQSSYSVLAQVLRSITNLRNREHRLLAFWFRTLEISRYRLVVSFVTQFLTVRQFPPLDKSLPPLNTTKWWIPTATKVLAILYAGSCVEPSILHYTEFYNSALDHLDLMAEYKHWQTLHTSDMFSYCQYPFVLSIVAKRHIMTKDAEQQMILLARRSLMSHLVQQHIPNIEVFFLNINVRRNRLIGDSLFQLSLHKTDLKKKLRVTFEGEPGLDMGGLTKEWFMLLVKEIFQPDNKLFVYHEKTRFYWFSISSKCAVEGYNLIGVLMGLAIYNSSILDVNFPGICYRKLLSPPVVPKTENASVGIAKKLAIKDLAEFMPDVSKSLEEILSYEGDVEEDMLLTFKITIEEYGEGHSFDLKENGDKIPVTNENREEFVNLYLDWILNSGIYDKFRAFYLGFHTVTASNALIMLRPEEVETLVCGVPNFNIADIRKVVEYDGYTKMDEVIVMLWDLLKEMDQNEQKKFLLFTTGSNRIPVGGISEMKFKISRWRTSTKMLPLAHTCFNQLMLPEYESPEELKDKLYTALNYAEGFGLE